MQYQISTGGGGEAPPPYTFCLPAAGQPMHWCEGNRGVVAAVPSAPHRGVVYRTAAWIPPGAVPSSLPAQLPAAACHSLPRGYYSCNGFSASVKEDAPERQDPTYLWRDMLQARESVCPEFATAGLCGCGRSDVRAEVLLWPSRCPVLTPACLCSKSRPAPSQPRAPRPDPPLPSLPQLHSAFPLHCLVGGGDQLYCDGVFKTEGSAALKAWGELAEQ